MKKLFIVVFAAMLLASCGGSGSKQVATEAEASKPAIEVVSHNLKTDEFSTTVFAVVKNNSDKTASYLDISSYFYDAEGVVLGSGMGNATEIAPGATKTIEIMCVDDVSKATQYKVELGNVTW